MDVLGPWPDLFRAEGSESRRWIRKNSAHRTTRRWIRQEFSLQEFSQSPSPSRTHTHSIANESDHPSLANPTPVSGTGTSECVQEIPQTESSRNLNTTLNLQADAQRNEGRFYLDAPAPATGQDQGLGVDGRCRITEIKVAATGGGRRSINLGSHFEPGYRKLGGAMALHPAVPRLCRAEMVERHAGKPAQAEREQDAQRFVLFHLEGGKIFQEVGGHGTQDGIIQMAGSQKNLNFQPRWLNPVDIVRQGPENG